MAQVGCFVPASSAVLGVCDRLFTRVGAVDDLAGVHPSLSLTSLPLCIVSLLSRRCCSRFCATLTSSTCSCSGCSLLNLSVLNCCCCSLLGEVDFRGRDERRSDNAAARHRAISGAVGRGWEGDIQRRRHVHRPGYPGVRCWRYPLPGCLCHPLPPPDKNAGLLRQACQFQVDLRQGGV